MSDPRQLAMFDLDPDPDPIRVDPSAPAKVAEARHVSAVRAMRALQRSLPVVADVDPDPPGLDGWRAYLGIPRPTVRRGVCSELEGRRRADGTLSPCAWTACPHSLVVDVGEVVEVGPVREAELVLSTAGLPVGMGRRPSLSALPETAGEIDAFTVEVLARLDGALPPLPWSCELDVIAAYPDGAPVAVIAEALGVSEEIARLAVVKVTARWFDERAEDATANLELVAPARPVATTAAPSKIGEPGPVPAGIRRVERDAPPVRELTAEDLFTF